MLDLLVLLQWQQGWKRIRDICKEAAVQQDADSSLVMGKAIKEEIAATDFLPLVRGAIRGGISGEG